ncbi:MAG: hypothetical protein HZB91_01855 [Elusimicrobia bacterium]|nr:hypothetical protein [Elusimicrobiota bacterium]
MTALRELFARDGKHRLWTHLGLVAALWAGSYLAFEAAVRRSDPLELVPGIELADVAASPGWERSGYAIVPFKRCRIRARVLGQEPYYYSMLSAVAPSDLLLGWGPLANDGVLEWLHVSQGDRGYAWSYQTAPVEREEITRHLASLVAIPANPLLGYRIRALKPGDLVALEGYVVRLRDPQGAEYQSPGTFSSQNEIVWIEKLAIQ